MEKNKILQVKNIGQCIGCYSCMLTCATNVYKNFSLKNSAIAVKTSGGYQGRMVVNICRGCKDAACAAACPTDALTPREGGGGKYKEELCIGCKKCVENCVAKAIGFDSISNKAVFCKQCGLCAKQCPHDVIGMEASQ
ncbi:MAG: (Fe-S)-binding protein [Clostridiaceae bacterium]|nr:(Fe-S)-binding protein [Clostridiaceae bacterium]